MGASCTNPFDDMSEDFDYQSPDFSLIKPHHTQAYIVDFTSMFNQNYYAEIFKEQNLKTLSHQKVYEILQEEFPIHSQIIPFINQLYAIPHFNIQQFVQFTYMLYNGYKISIDITAIAFLLSDLNYNGQIKFKRLKKVYQKMFKIDIVWKNKLITWREYLENFKLGLETPKVSLPQPQMLSLSKVESITDISIDRERRKNRKKIAKLQQRLGPEVVDDISYLESLKLTDKLDILE